MEKKLTLKELRSMFQLRQIDLAREVGCTQQAIQKAESGRTISRQLADNICAVYGISVDDVAELKISPRVYIRKAS